MTIPALFFGFLLSTLYGAAFHLVLGGRAGRLLAFLFLGWAGFWGGQLLAGRFGWEFGSIGTLHVGAATLSSLILLIFGYWLSLVDKEYESE